MDHVYYGIDFGTANCSVAYVADRPPGLRAPVPVATVTFDRGHGDKEAVRVPSEIVVPDTPRRPKAETPSTGVLRLACDSISAAAGSLKRKVQKAFYGFMAREERERLTHKDQYERGRNLFFSVKSDIGTLAVYDKAPSALNTPVKVVAALLNGLLDDVAAKELPDPRSCPTVLTVPANFGMSQRRALLEAARQAGLKVEDGSLLDEPSAALIDLMNDPQFDAKVHPIEPKVIMVFDFGAGTLDVSLVRVQYDAAEQHQGLRVETLGIAPYHRLGGDNLDYAILETVILPAVCRHAALDPHEVDGKLKKDFSSNNLHQAQTLKELFCNKVQSALKLGGGDWRKLRKSDLPVSVPSREVETHGVVLPRTNVNVAREDFERIMAPFLNKDTEWKLFGDDLVEASFWLPINSVLKQAGMDTGLVDFVVMNGGSCKNPYVTRFLKEDCGFAAKVIETPDLDASVARGAALDCYYSHRYKHRILPAIANEDVGIMDRDGNFVTLIRSGTELPIPPDGGMKEADKSFYVPDDNLEAVSIPIFAGAEGRRRIAEVCKLPLQGEVWGGTPLEVAYRLDANRVTHWRFRVKDGQFTEVEVENPWVNRLTSCGEREVANVSREIHTSVEADRRISSELWCRLAHALRRTGVKADLLKAKDIVKEQLENNEQSAPTHNLMGLILNGLGSQQPALTHYEKAAKLEPSEAVYRMNCGATLALLGRFPEAVRSLNEALEINPRFSHTYYWLGYAYANLSDVPRSQGAYVEAARLREAELQPQHRRSSEDWRQLADLYRLAGDFATGGKCDAQGMAARTREDLGVDPESIIASEESLWRIEEPGESP